MATFNDREKGFEGKFAHDQEKAFKVQARRNKLFGYWAAEMLELTGEDAEAYAREVIISDLDRPGDDDVLEKVLKDFQARQLDISEYRLKKELDRLFEVAARQLEQEGRI